MPVNRLYRAAGDIMNPAAQIARSFEMHRFKVDSIADGDIIVMENPGQVHHLKDVLRLAPGDEIALFDDSGRECLCKIARLDKRQVALRVEARKKQSLSKMRLVVACALPKKGMDDIVDKLTQLGVDSIIPMQTDRVVVKSREDRDRAKMDRWRRLAQSAAEQSQRSNIPEITLPMNFKEVVARSVDYDLKLIPNLAGERPGINDVVMAAKPKNVLVLIGPEGDFSPEEVSLAVTAGFVPVSLGQLVLRVDTAAVAVAAFIRLAVGT